MRWHFWPFRRSETTKGPAIPVPARGEIRRVMRGLNDESPAVRAWSEEILDAWLAAFPEGIGVSWLDKAVSFSENARQAYREWGVGPGLTPINADARATVIATQRFLQRLFDLSVAHAVLLPDRELPKALRLAVDTAPKDGPRPAVQSLLDQGRLDRELLNQGLVWSLQRSSDGPFRCPHLPLLFLEAGADPNTLLPYAPASALTCLHAAAYYGLITEATAGVWDKAGADWAKLDGAGKNVLQLVFEFKPLGLSQQAESLLGMALYVPRSLWSVSGTHPPQDEWDCLLRSGHALGRELVERMEAVGTRSWSSRVEEVALEKAVPPPSLPERPRRRL